MLVHELETPTHILEPLQRMPWGLETLPETPRPRHYSEEKEEKKAAKQRAVEQTQAREDSAAQFVEEYRARKDTEASNEAVAIPRRKPTKGQNELT